MTTTREYLEDDLRSARRQLADVTNLSRQTEPTERGRQYRQRLKRDIAELEARLASEDDDTLSEPPTNTESLGCRRSPEELQSDKERESFALQSQEPS